MESQPEFNLSGDRIVAEYLIRGGQAEAEIIAREICLEQTVEFPDVLVPEGFIRDKIVGNLESLESVTDGYFLAKTSYAVECSGYELPQLLNLLFGNSSIKPGIRVERFQLPDSFYRLFRGPRFGRDGLRCRLDVPERPLLCTALKPMGLSATQLADLAYQFALGGIDMIKDDHGLADQPFAPFRERVQRCAAAVSKANQETGGNCIYIPNITGPAHLIMSQAHYAKQAGAGGLMISPGLVGLDTVRLLAEDDDLALPIISHPSFQGSFVTTPDQGFSHFSLFGQLARLAGADVTIFPNYGGRFSFSREECRSIVAGTTVKMGPLKPIFPAPGGGMNLQRIPDMLEVYGRDVIFLIGGGLHQHGPDLIENCRYFLQLVSRI